MYKIKLKTKNKRVIVAFFLLVIFRLTISNEMIIYAVKNKIPLLLKFMGELLIDKNFIGISVGGIIGAWAAVTFSIQAQKRNERLKIVKKGKKAARIINKDLQVIEKELTYFRDLVEKHPDVDIAKHVEPIDYNLNWRDYFADLDDYAKFNYYEIISNEYKLAKSINHFIENKRWDHLKDYLMRIDSLKLDGGFSGFNYFEMFTNLLLISYDENELPCLLDQKDTLNKIKQLKDDYFLIIENKLYNKVVSVGSIDLSEIDDEITDWLKSSNDMKVIDKRILKKLVFDVCFDSKKLSFAWNHLDLVRD